MQEKKGKDGFGQRAHGQQIPGLCKKLEAVQSDQNEGLWE